MSLDGEVVLRASIGLIVFGLILCVIKRIARPAVNRKCRDCGRTFVVAGDQLDESRCSLCRASEQAASDESASQQPIESVPVCSACRQRLPESLTVPLWDGRQYCELCVAEHDATLPEYARRHDSLTATRRFSFWRALSGGLYTGTVLALGLLGTAALMAGILWYRGLLPRLRMPPRELAWLVAGTLGVGWCVLAVLSSVISLFVQWFAFPRTTAVRAGRVLISPPGERSVPLDDLLWAEGSSSHDSVEGASWPRRDGVLLFTRSTKRRSPGVLVGETEEDRQRWAAFLTLAGVPRQPLKPWRQVKRAPTAPDGPSVAEQASTPEPDPAAQ